MTLKELLDKVSELCNDETKDLPVTIAGYDGPLEATEVWRYQLDNDYIKVDEIRIS